MTKDQHIPSLDVNQNPTEIERRLFDALYALMQSRTIEELSVGDVLALARVSRTSFYRRFKDKYDLLLKSYGRLLESTFLRCMQEEVSWTESSQMLYAVLTEHPAFFRYAFMYEGQNNLKDYICDVILDCMRQRMAKAGVSLDGDWRLYVTAQAYLTGTMEMTCRWAKQGMPYPAQELISLLNEIMPPSLKVYCMG